MNQFHYSGQIRRFIIQFMRLLSNFQVEFGLDANGARTLQQVPVIYGDSSRQVAQIIAGNSENMAPTVPVIAVYISELNYDRARVQNPTHVSKIQIREREYDKTTGTYSGDQGGAFTVERLMPAPFTIKFKVDFWTSNQTQKAQLIEQITPLFSPGLEIQSTDNYLDWTSLSTVFLESTNYTSRSVPVNGNDVIDVFTATFSLPIWISLPARISRLGVIQKIIMSVYDDDGELVEDVAGLPGAMMLTRRVITPMNYGVVYYNGMLQLFRQNNVVDEDFNGIHVNGNLTSWQTFIDIYGTIRTGTSEIRLEQPNGSTVIGKIAYHPTDSSLLIFTPIADTIPTNTISPISAIVDPYSMNVDAAIKNASVGTRYLIINPIGSIDNIEPAEAWGNLIAEDGDIIEYDGTKWSVSFDASCQPYVKYCVNLKTGLQFKWDGSSWSKAVEGQYQPGEWTLVL